MPIRQLSLLMPSTSLEDFPLDQREQEARELLAGWTGLWHPLLLSAVGSIPEWIPAEYPPEGIGDALVFVPECCRDLMPEDWVESAEDQGVVLVDIADCYDSIESAGGGNASLANLRQRITDRALAELGRHGVDQDREAPTDARRALADPHARRFLAVAYVYFIVEVLTRKLNYMSNLDHDSFSKAMLEAAQAACAAGDDDQVNTGTSDLDEGLDRVLELLHESREYFYPVEAHLIDVTLTIPGMRGAALAAIDASLASHTPSNLLISGETLIRLAQRSPARIAALRAAIEKNTVGILGGETTEAPLALMPLEAIRRHLVAGLRHYQELLGARPKVFARRTAGLTPVLPAVLRDLGFVGAVHYSFDGIRAPRAAQSRFRWVGLGGAAIEALGRLPVDVSLASTMLKLADDLGGSMDMDTIATVVATHWPGKASCLYDDLRTSVERLSIVGAFETIEDYFDATLYSGYESRHDPDEYRQPVLRLAIDRGEANPISRWSLYYRRLAIADTILALRTLTGVLAAPKVNVEAAGKTVGDLSVSSNESPSDDPPTVDAEGVSDDLDTGEIDSAGVPTVVDPRAKRWESFEETGGETETLFARIEAARDDESVAEVTCGDAPTLDGALSMELSEAARTLARSVGSKVIDATAATTDATDPAGWLLLNMGGSGRRLNVPLCDTEQSPTPSVGGPVRSAASGRAVVEVAGTGFAWIPAATGEEDGNQSTSEDAPTETDSKPWRRGLFGRLAGKKEESPPPMAEHRDELTALRNEYFTAEFDPTTGAMIELSDYQPRGARIAQQIALRTGGGDPEDPGDDGHYTIMAADRIEVLESTELVGRLLCEGRLVDRHGQTLGGFRQTTTAERGSRVLKIGITLDLDDEVFDRFALQPWQHYAAARFAWADAAADTSRDTSLAVTATDVAQIESPLFFDIAGERRRTTILTGGLPFHRKFGLRKLDTLLVVPGETARSFELGIAIDVPDVAAAGLGLIAPTPTLPCSAGPATPSAWLMHLDTRGVTATSWRQVIAEDGTPALMVRLLETQGRAATIGLSTVRPPLAARQLRPPGEASRELKIDAGRVLIPMKSHEWVTVVIEME